jgi:hypothetical protein
MLLGGCFGPLRCEQSEPEPDEGVVPTYDFAIGELGRAVGNKCTTLDNCNRFAADSCGADGRCACGNDAPCDSGLACCDGRCVDVDRDPQNCGGCGIACGTGQCVRGDLGGAHCTCDVDAGTGSCSSSLEPTCNADGLCSCGPSSVGVCNSQNADSCGASGCSCGGGPACGGQMVDHCEPGVGCRCGDEPACDPKLATSCDPTRSDGACRCAQGPGCSPGTFCCTQNSTCCGPSQFCCLNGCCDHPCLLLGFCDH